MSSADMNEEDILDDVSLAAYILFPDSASKDLFIIFERMMPVCTVYDVDFKDVL